jgi:hypothetical protein
MKSDSSRPTVEQLLGAWQLVSIEDTVAGTTRPAVDLGAHPAGLLIYTPDGYMCATLVDGERAAWKDATSPTDAEKIAYYESFIAYAGTFRLDAETSVVHHYPTIAWSPAFVGTAQARPFRLEGDKLIITVTADLGDPRMEKRVLVWQRAKGSAQ